MIEGFSRVNFEAAADFVVNDLGKCGDNNDCKPAVLDTDRQIEEETTSFYAQLNKDFELMDMPASLVVGIRHEETEVTSTAKVPNPDDDTAAGLQPMSSTGLLTEQFSPLKQLSMITLCHQ